VEFPLHVFYHPPTWKERNHRQKMYLVLLTIRRVAKAVTAMLKNFSEILIYDSNSHSKSLSLNYIVSCLFSCRYNPQWLYFPQPGSEL
jgi:hypothetical protein